jgi:hypothetical protein
MTSGYRAHGSPVGYSWVLASRAKDASHERQLRPSAWHSYSLFRRPILTVTGLKIIFDTLLTEVIERVPFILQYFDPLEAIQGRILID